MILFKEEISTMADSDLIGSETHRCFDPEGLEEEVSD